MPFDSEKQRRYLWARHPEIAKRWADEEIAQNRKKLKAREEKRRKGR
jgi:hypothetical protein